jgi:hypothetical protein
MSSIESKTVRRAKESKQAMGTHTLLSAEGGLTEDTKRKPASKGHPHSIKHRGATQNTKRKPVGERHLHPIKCRGRYKSGHLKKACKARGTHILLSTEGRLCQYIKSKQESKESTE